MNWRTARNRTRMKERRAGAISHAWWRLPKPLRPHIILYTERALPAQYGDFKIIAQWLELVAD